MLSSQRLCGGIVPTSRHTPASVATGFRAITVISHIAIITEQIKLLIAFARRQFFGRGHITGNNCESTHQQPRIHNTLVQHGHRLANTCGR